MKESSKRRMSARIQTDLETLDVYDGPLGRHTLAGVLGRRFTLHDIFHRLHRIIASRYEPMIEALEDKRDTLETEGRAVKAERKALARKLSQRPDVVLWENMTVPEVFEIMHLRNEGVTAAKIAHLFDLPISTVQTILKAATGKARNKVVYDAEQRRRRAASVMTRQTLTGQRDLDIEDAVHEPALPSHVVELRRKDHP